MSPLLERREELLWAIRQGYVPPWAREELERLVEKYAQAVARAEAASHARSAKVRGRIERAVGAMPPDKRGALTVTRRRIERDGERASPRTIGIVLHDLAVRNKSVQSDLVCAHGASHAAYAATSATT